MTKFYWRLEVHDAGGKLVAYHQRPIDDPILAFSDWRALVAVEGFVKLGVLRHDLSDGHVKREWIVWVRRDFVKPEAYVLEQQFQDGMEMPKFIRDIFEREMQT